MTPAEALRALDKAMTPGPWVAAMNGPYPEMDATDKHGISRSDAIDFLKSASLDELLAIATLRNALPALVAVLKAADLVNRGHGGILDTVLAALTEKLDV